MSDVSQEALIRLIENLKAAIALAEQDPGVPDGGMLKLLWDALHHAEVVWEIEIC